MQQTALISIVQKLSKLITCGVFDFRCFLAAGLMLLSANALRISTSEAHSPTLVLLYILWVSPALLTVGFIMLRRIRPGFFIRGGQK